MRELLVPGHITCSPHPVTGDGINFVWALYTGGCRVIFLCPSVRYLLPDSELITLFKKLIGARNLMCGHMRAAFVFSLLFETLTSEYKKVIVPSIDSCFIAILSERTPAVSLMVVVPNNCVHL